MQRGNGAVIGKQNTPTTSVATGVWALNEVQRAVLGGNWPASTIVDPYFDYTTLLLHGNGTNGAQNNTFLDSSTNNFTITRNGNTTQGTFTPYGSNWSNYFGATGQYLSVAYSSAFNLTGDFTIECWINPGNLPSSIGTAAQSYERVFSFGTYNAANSLGLEINSNDSGNLRRFISWYNGTSYGLGSNNAVAPGNWYHIAMVRSGTTITLYLNGTSIGTITGASAAVNTSQAFYIASLQGFEGDASAAFNGYISNFRIVKSAVYTSNFTPSASPLTAITNTVLLTCQDNRFRDNSTNNATVSVAGSPSVQRFSPFNPTAAYSAATIGGSGYFDGSGDFLAAPDNTALEPGSSDLTWEMWINTTNSTPYATLYSRTTASFATGMWSLMMNFASASAGDLALFVADYSPTLPLLQTSGANVRDGAWHHIAVVRNGSAWALYVDGVSRATQTWSGTIADITGGPYIGRDQYYGRDYTGYISNLRVLKGTAVYISAFTPPTAPVTAISGTSLLLNFTNGGIIDNAMMNNLETVGNAQVSTSVVKYGTGSMAFDGSGDYLFAANNPGQRIMGGDFTVEMWMYLGAAQANMGLVSSYENNNGWIVRLDTTYIRFFYGISGSGTANDVTYSFSPGVWYHIAWVKSGTSLRCYINGTQQGSTFTVSGAVDTTTAGMQVGRTQTNTNDFNGYIDDLRITKGYARYTANFTPPTAPFPDQ